MTLIRAWQREIVLATITVVHSLGDLTQVILPLRLSSLTWKMESGCDNWNKMWKELSPEPGS